jgi:hypothetical protein
VNDARKSGLLAMAIFGAMGVGDFCWAVYYPNEASGLLLTFGLFILVFGFLMGFVQFVTGEFPPEGSYEDY